MPGILPGILAMPATSVAIYTEKPPHTSEATYDAHKRRCLWKREHPRDIIAPPSAFRKEELTCE